MHPKSLTTLVRMETYQKSVYQCACLQVGSKSEKSYCVKENSCYCAPSKFKHRLLIIPAKLTIHYLSSR